MMSRSAPGSNVYQASVVTMLDRACDDRAPVGGSRAFQLQPYTAAPADAINPFDNQLTYADEVMGFVTFLRVHSLAAGVVNSFIGTARSCRPRSVRAIG